MSFTISMYPRHLQRFSSYSLHCSLNTASVQFKKRYFYSNPHLAITLGQRRGTQHGLTSQGLFLKLTDKDLPRA